MNTASQLAAQAGTKKQTPFWPLRMALVTSGTPRLGRSAAILRVPVPLGLNGSGERHRNRSL